MLVVNEHVVHFVRHGEVENPTGVLYGRLPGFHLSARGQEMAELAAKTLVPNRPSRQDAAITRIVSSPLERAVESATPIARRLGLTVEIDDRLLEAESYLEGGQFEMSLSILAKPAAWRFLVNPFRPSWGEPFAAVAARIGSLIAEIDRNSKGDVVFVSHQLPIWLAHRQAMGRSLAHDPRKRRCALSSITTLKITATGYREVSYRPPAAGLLGGSVDVGAV
ncbi:histidine phosphatase family protein [Cryobacterium sp. Hz9]|uniref:histidine phosphatase family protein n=1 Tax=Cryobacterium sp. Hz9 TaxID=1259167 RepID=UPI00141B476F|nr:histidine phosphatase family protein [Cryobacterium sp. Hz9]